MTKRLALTLAAGVLIGLFVHEYLAWGATRESVGFPAYYTASRLLVERQLARVYDDAWFAAQLPRMGFPNRYEIFHVQPPTMALLFLPLVELSAPAARVLWTLASFVFVALGTWRLARFLGLSGIATWWILPIVLWSAPFIENLRAGQVYALLYFPLAVALESLQTERFARAGIALGLLAILKAAALWLWPLLLFDRRGRRAVGWAIGSAGAVALVTLPAIGLAAWRSFFVHLPSLADNRYRLVTAYQTTTSLLARLLVRDSVLNPKPLADHPTLARVLTLAIVLATLAITMAVARAAPASAAGRRLTLALYGALLVASAPVGEIHHSLLVLPSLLVALVWARSPAATAPLRAAAALAWLLVAAPLDFASSPFGLRSLLAYPHLYGAYVLWGVLILAIRSERGRLDGDVILA